MTSYLRQKLAVCRELGLVRLGLLPLAIVFVLSLLLLSKVMKVRVHEVQNGRIGHFTVYTVLTYLELLQSKSNLRAKGINIYAVTSLRSSNTYLEIMWKRKVFLITGKFGWLIVDIFNRIPNNKISKEIFGNDRNGLILQHPPALTFIPEEIAIGTKFLGDLGIAAGQKYVCLHVRDSSYLANSWNYFGYSPRHDWSHHDYRNSEINTYVAAAEALAEMGYTVFRMGAIVEKPLISKHPLVIDYATNGMRTEFLDIFLGAHCTFCVSTGSGWDSIPQIFRRPSLYVNLLPHFPVDCVVRKLLIYPKNLVDRYTKVPLKLDEILERNIQTIHSSRSYEDARVEIRNLNSEELVEAVTEMVQRLEGTFVETQKQKEMQAKLKNILSTNPKLQTTPNYYPIRVEFASCFLSNNSNFLD